MRRFITILTTPCHFTLSGVKRSQPIPSRHSRSLELSFNSIPTRICVFLFVSSFQVCQLNPARISHFFKVSAKPLPAYSPWFYHSNNTGGIVHTVSFHQPHIMLLASLTEWFGHIRLLRLPGFHGCDKARFPRRPYENLTYDSTTRYLLSNIKN